MVGLISMGLVVGGAAAQTGDTSTPAPGAEATPTTAPKACSECHPNIADEWSLSSHAHAYDNAEFTARHASAGNPGECLVCHTTGYQANTGMYSAEGVTCEACHGQTDVNHPPAPAPIRGDTEYCGSCHTPTLAEWRLTGHSAANVGCKDCHDPHSQKARFENPDEMCVNCHKDTLGEHQTDVHIQENGITCVDCHMLRLPPDPQPVNGLVPTGHMFTITPNTCVACHTDTFKAGKPLPGYEAGAKAVSQGQVITSTLPGIVAEYTGTSSVARLAPEQRIQALEAALASTRLSTLFQGGIVGLVLGGTTAFFMARNTRRENEEPGEEVAVDQPPGPSPEEEPGDEQA